MQENALISNDFSWKMARRHALVPQRYDQTVRFVSRDATPGSFSLKKRFSSGQMATAGEATRQGTAGAVEPDHGLDDLIDGDLGDDDVEEGAAHGRRGC
jgi:hypothetical protein